MPQLIPPRVPITDPRTGLVSTVWYRFFNSWFDQTGGYDGVIPATSGGTGYSSYTVGDILYAGTATTLSRLNDVATGNALISGGVGVAPTWGKINLGSHVTGTLLAAQFPALTGDVTTPSGSLATTLATVNTNIGTFNNVTVNGKGLVTAASNVAYITGNQTITLSGDATGSGATAITVTLKSVGTAGTYTKVTTDAQGRVSAGATAAASDLANGTTGSNEIVLKTSPTLVTPTLGVATATSINKVSVTSPATSATLTIQDGKTLSYEEGTWSPQFRGTGTAGTYGYAIQTGTYTKVGRLVTATCTMQLNAITVAGTGVLRIYGLPYAVRNLSNYGPAGSLGLVENYAAANAPITLSGDPGGSYIAIYKPTNGAATGFGVPGDLATNTYFTCTLTYEA